TIMCMASQKRKFSRLLKRVEKCHLQRSSDMWTKRTHGRTGFSAYSHVCHVYAAMHPVILKFFDWYIFYNIFLLL
ncbi:unnamed protein product, partial [Candidula unifasciata]